MTEIDGKQELDVHFTLNMMHPDYKGILERLEALCTIPHGVVVSSSFTSRRESNSPKENPEFEAFLRGQEGQ